MISVLQAMVVAISISFGATVAFAQVTRAEIRAAISSDSTPALVDRIKSLPQDARRRSAVEMMSYMNQEVASNGEFSNGKVLLGVLPHFADDDLLAEALRPYLDDKDRLVRGIAFMALSRGRGTETGKLMSNLIRAKFDKLPLPPFRPVGEDEARSVNENAEAFVLCLEGLLLSSAPEAQEQGRRYLSLLRARYSAGTEGKAVLDEILGELKRGGALVDAGTSGPPGPNSTPIPPSTPSTARSIAKPSSPPRATHPDDAKRLRSRLWTYCACGFGVVALIIIAVWGVNRRRSGDSQR